VKSRPVPVPEKFNQAEHFRSSGYVSAIDSNGRTIWIAEAHGDDGQRFVVLAEEKLTAFLELESAVRVSIRRSHKN